MKNKNGVEIRFQKTLEEQAHMMDLIKLENQRILKKLVKTEIELKEMK